MFTWRREDVVVLEEDAGQSSTGGQSHLLMGTGGKSEKRDEGPSGSNHTILAELRV
jgi:hypothetical protein